MPITEFLLDNLSKTTAAYMELQEKETRLGSDLALAQAQLFPLRKDNARLTRENHQLHVDNIRKNDEATAAFTDQNKTIRKLQDEVANLTLAQKMKHEECDRMEAEKERLRELYEDLADPSLKNKGTSKRSIRMTAPAPPAEVASASNDGMGSSASLDYSQQTDEKAAMDGKVISTLREQLDQSNLKMKHQADEIAQLKESVRARELELARSTRMDLEDVGTTRLEQLVAADTANKRIIDQLNGQVDFLNEQVAYREAQIADSSYRVKEADDYKLDYENKMNYLESLKSENDKLRKDLSSVETQFDQLRRVINPDGGVQVDELFNSNSAHSAKALTELFGGNEAAYQMMKENLQNEGFLDKEEVALPEVSRMSGSDEKINALDSALSGKKSSKNVKSSGYGQSKGPGKSKSKDALLDEQLQSLSAREAKLVSSGRKIVTDRPRRGGVDHSADVNLLTVQEHKSMVAALTEERDNLALDNERLQELFESKVGGEALIKERMRQGESKIGELRDEVGEMNRMCQQFASEIKAKDSYIKQRDEEILQMQQMLEQMTTKASENTLTSVEMSRRANQAEAMISSAVVEREKADNLVNTLQKDLSKLRMEKVDLMGSNEEMEGKNSILERLLVEAKRAEETLTTDVNRLKTNLVKKDMEMDEVKSELEAASRRLRGSEDLLESTRNDLQTKSEALTEAVSRLSQYEMSKLPEDIAEKLKSDIYELRKKCDVMEEVNRRLQQDKMLANQNTRDVTRQKELVEEQRDAIERDKSKLASDIMLKNDSILDLKKENHRLELELDRVNTQVRNQENTVNTLTAAAESRQEEVYSTLSQSQQMSADIHMLTRRVSDAEDAYKASREELDKERNVVKQLTLRASDAESEVDSLSNLVKANQEEIGGLQTQISILKTKLDNACQNLDSERSEVSTAANRETELLQKISELKIGLSVAEKDSRAQALKNTRLLATLQQGEDGTRNLQGDLVLMKETIAEKDNKIEDLLETLRNLDNVRDNLQNELDEYTERDAAKQKELVTTHQKYTQSNQLLEATERKLKDSTMELANVRKACGELDSRLTSVREENNELKRKFGLKNADIAGAAEDLMLMTKENQALTGELAETSSDRDRLRKKLQESMHRMHNLEQARRALEIERTDLIDTYRTVLSEKRRMENELNALGELKQRSGMSMQNLHEQLAELRGIVDSHNTAEKRWMTERSSMVQQLETINDEMVRSRGNLEAVEADNRRLMQDTHALKQKNAMLKERVTLVIQRATKAADNNKILASRLAAVQRERDAVRAVVVKERETADEFGMMVEQTRAELAAKDMIIQR